MCKHMSFFKFTININSNNNNTNNSKHHSTNDPGSEPPGKQQYNKNVLLILGIIFIVLFYLANSDNSISFPDLLNIFTTTYIEKLFDSFL